MRVSFLLPDLRGGGVERIRLVLAGELVRAGHEVEFALMQVKGELVHEACDHFSILDLGVTRTRSLLLPLVRYLRQRRPDALFAAMWPLTVIAPLAVRLSGHRCKVLVSEHNTLSVQYRDWPPGHRAAMKASMALGYRLADCRVGVSMGVADDISQLSGLRRDAFNVIHNPVTPRVTPSDTALAEADALWSIPSGARIVTVGSMKAQKNHRLLLRAFALLNRPDARLMFVGDGAERTALLSLARELGVADRVILAGFRPDPTPFYSTADLFVLSSDYEGFGNVIVEALACGTPVVSTDCLSGPSEILDGGRFGRLVPVGDDSAMAQAITETLAGPVCPSPLIDRASQFRPEIAARKYIEVLGI